MLSIKTVLSITFVVLFIFAISSSVDAAFKKLPLNGSMFGKRGTSIGEWKSKNKSIFLQKIDKIWYFESYYLGKLTNFFKKS